MADGNTKTSNSLGPSRSRIKSFSTGDLRSLNVDLLFPKMSSLNIKTPEEAKSRLIIVANRLPVTVKRAEDGKYNLLPSSGGLASGLAGVTKTTKCLSYGWVGLDVPNDDREEMKRRCWDEYGSIPIFISESLSEGHYNGFSNSILWPLFHYHPEGISFEGSTWNAYQEVNRIFAKTIAQDLKDNDIVWVQDYHLMLLPAMLREELAQKEDSPKNIKIGFFLHTAFPSSEIYRILPTREEILEGVLQSDLIGFHTIDYVRHFLNSCAKVLHLKTTPGGVHFQDKFVAVQDFPLGIDPEKFKDGLELPEVRNRIKSLKARFTGVKVVVGVDRLDYIKGMQQKLHAFEVFLTQHPEWIGKIVLVQVAVPSRGDVEEYQNLRATVNELVGRINGKFSTIEFSPIHFLHQSVSFNELISLYAISDACLVTSTRDGMNLVSYEYIACQKERHGSMILSEFTGAAKSLNGSLIINPWDTDNVAEAIHNAVTMSAEQRKSNYGKLSNRVNKYTSQWWGSAFTAEILRISKSTEETPVEMQVDKSRHDLDGAREWSAKELRGEGVTLSHEDLAALGPKFSKDDEDEMESYLYEDTDEDDESEVEELMLKATKF